MLLQVLPTVGLNVGRLDINKAELLLWDLGGQPGLRSIWDKYYADSHGVIFVVDCTTPARYSCSINGVYEVLIIKPSCQCGVCSSCCCSADAAVIPGSGHC